jgi:hypothetical protein
VEADALRVCEFPGDPDADSLRVCEFPGDPDADSVSITPDLASGFRVTARQRG